MERFTRLTGVAAPLMRHNVDTDAIIPGRELMKVTKTGYAEGLFANWRYTDGDRAEDPDFVLNRQPYRKAVILLAGHNFACGSSREVAAWALRDFGIRCVIAPSYGHIFHANCFRNSMLPVTLPIEQVEAIAAQVEQSGGRKPVTVDLESCTVTAPDGQQFSFTLAELARTALLEGLDAISSTLRYADRIAAYQARDRVRRPWVYDVPAG
jgi:3-isopropylmalate/(R)-2-methylmalate dehydratase small subunit